MVQLIVITIVVSLFGVVNAQHHYGWMTLVHDRKTSTAPNVEDFRSIIESSGLTFLSAHTSTRHPTALWYFLGNHTHWRSFSSHPLAPHQSVRYSTHSSNRANDPIALSLATRNARTAAGNWALQRIVQRSLPLLGNYDPGATGAGVNVYVVDTGVGYNVDLVGRVSQDFTVFSGSPQTALDDCNGRILLHVSYGVFSDQLLL